MNKPLIVVLAVYGMLTSSHAGVLSHYTFDSDYTDSSGNGNDGTFVDVGTIGNSGITTTTGEYKFGGGGLHLTEDRDYVAVAEKLFSSTSGAYSFAFWAKRANVSDEWAMVLGDQSDGADFIALNNANYLRQRGALNEAVRQHDYTVTSDTAWHHYVITGDGGGFFTGTMSLYLDGSLVESVDGKSTGFTLNAIGAAYLAANNFDFEGQIDEVWVFDEVLTEAAAANLFLYNNPVGEPATSVLTYHFDGDYTDSSLSANDGTASGTAGLTADTNLVVVGSGALLLDGADASYVALSNTVSFTALDAWSVAFWAQRSENGNEKGMVLGERNTTDDFIWLNDNFTGLRFRSSTSDSLDFTVAKDLNLHHYALVANGNGNLSLYVDGVSVESLNGNTSFIIDTVGQAYPTTSLHYGFSGVLDETRVYQGALTGSEILDLYNENPQSPVVTQRHRVFLLGGQSNMVGQGVNNELVLPYSVAQNDVNYWDGGAWVPLSPGFGQFSYNFGPEVAFGRAIKDALPNETIYLVKYAVNGTALYNDWKPTTGPQYIGFMNTANSALTALDNAGIEYEISGMLWMQGESDASEGEAASYEANLINFIDVVRTEFSAPEMPFIIARVRTYYGGDGESPTQADIVRAAQVTVAESTSYVSWFDTDAYQMANEGHYGTQGQLDLGNDYAAANLAYILPVIRVFLQAGQSNADGRAVPGDLPTELQYPQAEIDFYYKVEGGSGTLTTLRPGLSETHQFGPEITFGHDINSMLISDSTTRVAIIKYANGGTKLSTQWYAGGDATQTGDGPEYTTFQNTVTSGMAALAAAYTGAVIEIEGMIWHQGESDTELDAHANAYAANLTDFIADIRATYGTDLPFVVGRLSSLQTALNATRLETVRAAQTSVAENDPYVGLVDTDSFSLAGDHLHYNAAGQQPMGSAFARQLGYQLWIPGLFTPEQLAAGDAEPGADADSDGASNEDEFIAGTLPNDAISVLWGELKPVGSDLFEIRYPGAVDRLFTVESTTNLVDGAWVDQLPWTLGNGAIVTQTITNSVRQGFMRVRAKLP